MLVMAALLLAACQPAAQAATPQSFGAGGQRPNFQIQPAQELPTTQPVVTGIVVNQANGVLTVSEGNFNFRGGANGTPRPTSNGTPRPRPTPGGGTEIQVDASNAQVYQDVTFANLNGQPPSGTIQQKVETSNVDGISDNSRVTVWGDRNGDQIVAKVIVYSQPRPFQQQP